MEESAHNKEAKLLLEELRKEAAKGDKEAKEMLSLFASEYFCQRIMRPGFPECTKMATHWEWEHWERKWQPICDRCGPLKGWLVKTIIKPDWKCK